LKGGWGGVLVALDSSMFWKPSSQFPVAAQPPVYHSDTKTKISDRNLW